jgi:hypothetical protein
MAKGNASNTSWDVCDRILADAGEARARARICSMGKWIRKKQMHIVPQ